MNIAVIGTGGVGGYFGAKLASLAESGSGLHVSFIARGMHLRVIQKNGLLVDSDEGKIVCMPSLATDDMGALPQPDLCLVCVKGYDLSAALVHLAPVVSEKTVIIPLMNGVDIYERIRTGHCVFWKYNRAGP